MRFKAPELEAQYLERLHPRVRDVARRFDVFCIRMGYGPAVITSISRNPEFYEQNALERPAFSWHLIDCAVDFRNNHLPRAKQAACEEWLHSQCLGSEWELVFRYHGTGPHWHVAFRDFSRRKEFRLTHPPTPPRSITP